MKWRSGETRPPLPQFLHDDIYEAIRTCFAVIKRGYLGGLPKPGDLVKQVEQAVVDRLNRDHPELLADPSTEESRKLRLVALQWIAWETCVGLVPGRQVAQPPAEVPSVLCLAVEQDELTVESRTLVLSASDWRRLADKWAWYWSGTEEAFRSNGLSSLFVVRPEVDGPRGEEHADDERMFVCLKIEIPKTLEGISMTANFRDRVDTISNLHLANARLAQVSRPVPSTDVIRLRFRLNQ
jgi:hypothetical protein